ncbi:hypothetical protein FisN_1Hu151 [Fistulifera solaris]|uniref:Uncharacterized protein n=1 Tax=Fistulifera solaris TaxID=1519565 RepID=A0A1Z5JEB3_FISSO|nr:hypothetical protein FisN_1Hu151 [Fistulifera solaris]|eukprot:GAX12222.1 hypothetical protein FisN_1Hu151 [Fistulifera solaris]
MALIPLSSRKATWCSVSAVMWLVLGTSVNGATFQDDRGVVHTWDNSVKARIGINAGTGAVTLFHMGMKADQLAAIWGLWGLWGSTFDPENPSAGSVFPEMDPGPEEAAFLASAVNLSPSCYKNPRGCWQIDNITDLVAIKDQIDFIVNMDNGYDLSMIDVEAAGFKVIFIDTYYDYNKNCRLQNFTAPDRSSCYGRSTMDLARRIEELATFLGVEMDHDALNQQKQEACEAASAFTDAMEEAHEKGLHIKVSWLAIVQDAETGASYAELSDYDPIQLWFPRSMEELGMPLLHADDIYDSDVYAAIPASSYFNNCEPGDYNDECTGNTLFPVDFWLFDPRGTRLIDENFKVLFPDKAILADQWWYVPKEDGPVSYKAIASYLGAITPRIAAAKKIHETTQECTPADPRDIGHVVVDGTGGLPLNGIVCFNRSLIQEEYLKCPNAMSPSAPVEAPVTIAPTAPESPVAPVAQSQATATSDGVRLPYAFIGIGTSALITLFANY